MNKKYIINIENLMNFIFEDDIKRDTDSEITEVYVSDDDTNEMMLSTKQIREVKSGDSSSKFNIKYDLIKNFIDMISDMESDMDSDFGKRLIFNTLCTYGIITEIN